MLVDCECKQREGHTLKLDVILHNVDCVYNNTVHFNGVYYNGAIVNAVPHDIMTPDMLLMDFLDSTTS